MGLVHARCKRAVYGDASHLNVATFFTLSVERGLQRLSVSNHPVHAQSNVYRAVARHRRARGMLILVIFLITWVSTWFITYYYQSACNLMSLKPKSETMCSNLLVLIVDFVSIDFSVQSLFHADISLSVLKFYSLSWPDSYTYIIKCLCHGVMETVSSALEMIDDTRNVMPTNQYARLGCLRISKITYNISKSRREVLDNMGL